MPVVLYRESSRGRIDPPCYKTLMLQECSDAAVCAYMPVTYFINQKRRLVLSIAWGEVTAAEFRDHQERLRSDPDFDPTFDQLGDLTQVTDVKIAPEEMRIVAEGALFARRSRRVFVASDRATFGMVRMFEAYRDASGNGEQLAILPDHESATKWLCDQA